MAAPTPRKRPSSSKRKAVQNPTTSAQEAPWSKGNPEKKIGLNVPFPEPLMMQLDYLVQHRAITSKSSFIRDAVAAAAAHEVERLRRVQEAMRRIDEEDRYRR